MSAQINKPPFKFEKGKAACLRIYEALVWLGRPASATAVAEAVGRSDNHGVLAYIKTMQRYGVVEYVGLGYEGGSNRRSMMYRPTTVAARNAFFSMAPQYGRTNPALQEWRDKKRLESPPNPAGRPRTPRQPKMKPDFSFLYNMARP